MQLSGRMKGSARALALGLCAGALFGIQAGLTKATTSHFSDGIGAVFTSWEIYALVVVALTGVVLQQKAFAAWQLSASEPAIVVTTPVIASILGIVVFEETIGASTLGWVLIAIAVAVMTYATVALAQHSATEGTVARPSEGKIKPVARRRRPIRPPTPKELPRPTAERCRREPAVDPLHRGGPLDRLDGTP